MSETVDLADAILLKKLREGDRTAFDQFYAKYWKPLYRLAFKILKDEEDSEDVIQETFFRFWENRKKLESTHIKGWLSTTSYRLVLKILQTRKQQDGIDGISHEEPLAEPADQSLDMRQLQLQIDACVEKLPDQCRNVYKLSREEYLSVKDIANKLNISPNTVEIHITRALKKIRIGLGYLIVLIFLSL
ncbi:RNA polymerase sigma factor [Mucilaginibacter sp.]|jgi:RNA polymerase sigma-70 factor (ECF subfamily)|uniref:RNA polymerase sigma factor n=1 Tax=Mucilaginibacter sp. TaxID=1882438 RepID=UPI0035685DD0